jgi:hypothetical protein
MGSPEKLRTILLMDACILSMDVGVNVGVGSEVGSRVGSGVDSGVGSAIRFNIAS